MAVSFRVASRLEIADKGMYLPRRANAAVDLVVENMVEDETKVKRKRKIFQRGLD